MLATSVEANAFDFKAGLSERAKWKSFGVEDWTRFDPMELARPSRGKANLSEWELPVAGGKLGQLKALIAFAEAGPKGYDAVHVSARIKPPKRPTDMSLGEIYAWIKATPNQPHAIGRYQFIPSTLASLVNRANLSTGTRFTPRTQDKLAHILLQDAGLARFMSGRLSRERFMNNLAKIWAGLPLSSGKSAYHGYAGNKATITRSFFDREMRKIFGG